MRGHRRYNIVCFQPQIAAPIDFRMITEEQKNVDKGHSPWKTDPIAVAQVFASQLISPEGITGDYPIADTDIEIIKSSSTDAIARIYNDKSIAGDVYLKRLTRMNDTGVWTVTGYDPAAKPD